ncbi:MAG: response regulator [Candidatus Omnitrophota bacterium]
MDDENKIKANNNIQVLLVDDEGDFLATMEFWLKSQGYKVETVSSGMEAIRFLKGKTPNVVFLDIMMPQMDGIETLRQIRAFNKDLPVVMITAHGDEEKRNEAYKLNAFAFFDKTKDFYEADNIIRSVLHFFTKPKKDL